MELRRSSRIAKKVRIAKCPPPMPRVKKTVKVKTVKSPSVYHPNAGNDDFNTPANAWLLADKYLKIKDKKVWCPFYNDGNITCHFKNRIHENRDFFMYEPDDYECVCDNPPYSIKKEVIKKLVENGKPFALLIPLDTIIRRYFREGERDDFTMIIPKSVFKFKGKNKTISVNTAWFCWGFKLGKQIIWEE